MPSTQMQSKSIMSNKKIWIIKLAKLTRKGNLGKKNEHPGESKRILAQAKIRDSKIKPGKSKTRKGGLSKRGYVSR